jgi:hypothetical protein
MRTPHEVHLKLILIVPLLAFQLSTIDTKAQVPCQTPPSEGQDSTWRQNSTVNVMIDPTFSAVRKFL